MARPTYIVLSQENLRYNLSTIRARYPLCKVIAMVKANAYGHGIRRVSGILEGHVEYFGVSCIDEALVLRNFSVQTPIILMEGVFCPSEFMLAWKHGLSVVFQSSQQWEWFKAAPVPVKAWLKIDTGMGRLGFTLLEAERIYEEMYHHNSIEAPFGIMSHFACADITGHPMNVLQYQAFSKFLEGKSAIKSLENSASCLIPQEKD